MHVGRDAGHATVVDFDEDESAFLGARDIGLRPSVFVWEEYKETI